MRRQALAATAAEQRAERSAQLFGFTRTDQRASSAERRIELIEMLWEVAYADGALDPLEDTMLRQVGGLIDVSDHERGAARRGCCSGWASPKRIDRRSCAP